MDTQKQTGKQIITNSLKVIGMIKGTIQMFKLKNCP